MSETKQNDHAWFREHIAAAIAGGLDELERVRFDEHARQCEACAAELRAQEELERHMNSLFALPAPGLEDRVIASLRRAPRRVRLRLPIHPAIRRAVTGVAAAILIAGVGYHVDQQLAGPAARAKSASNLRQINQQIALYANDNRRAYPGTQASGFELKFNDAPGAEHAVASDLNPGHVWYDHRSQQNSTDWDKDAQVPALRGTNTYAGGTVITDGGGGGGGGGGVERYYSRDLDRGDTQAGRNLAGTYGYFKPAEIALRGDQSVVEGKGVEVVRAGEEVQPVPVQQQQMQQAPPVQQLPAPVQGQADIVNVSARKVIRTGQMEFEVDRFDAAFATVSKLIAEAGGYVGTTDSEKLPNGKVKGTVTLRVPPERLDTLVLQLRGIGDLRSQKLDANDITKQYTDLESELRAARAMEERLLAIIKEGTGEIKDLLAAEKELGNWRTKIEKIVGQMRYYDNQVALSTLVVSLFERDIRTPATATQTETIEAGVESPDVETARIEALKAIEDAKGRVIQSELKRHDAGQFGASIIAEIPPENAGKLLDRLKQIGKVARLDIQRKQTTDASADTAAPIRVETKHTRLSLSLYNLANVAPRVSSSLTLAADDVDAAYRAIIERVNKTAGRVVVSNLAKGKPDQTTGTISFEVPTADADAVLNDLSALGDVMKLTVQENPDVQNATEAKRGFALTLISTAAVPPRESTTMTIEARDVESAMATLPLAVSQAGGRIIEANLSKERDGATAGKLSFEAPLAKATDLIEQATKYGAVRAVQRSQNLDIPAGNLAKARVDLQLMTADLLSEAGGGPLTRIRQGLTTSLKGLLWSLELLVIGICFVLPFALVLWGGWKLLKRTPKLRRDVAAADA